MSRVKTEPLAGTATRVTQHAKLVLRTRRVLYQNALLKAHVRRLQAVLHMHKLCSCYAAPKVEGSKIPNGIRDKWDQDGWCATV